MTNNKNVLSTTIFSLISLFVCVSANAGMYTWTDSNGVKHYGDSAPEGVKAEAVKAPQITVLEGYSKQWQAPEYQNNNVQPKLVTPEVDEREANAKNTVYEELSLLAPKSGQVIRANDGSITVMATVKPKLEEGHKFQLMYNGSVAKTSSSRALNLENLSRGEHTVQVSIVDQEGATLIQSDSIGFSILRTSKIIREFQERQRLENSTNN